MLYGCKVITLLTLGYNPKSELDRMAVASQHPEQPSDKASSLVLSRLVKQRPPPLF
jgi:hypothetical protein